MTRMVEEQREQIGILKALGCADRTIVARYLGFALLPTAAGAVLGVLAGEKCLPYAILRTYSMLYTGLPVRRTPLDMREGAVAVMASVCCTCAAAVLACYQIFRACPAQIMRLEAPKNGKRVLLERIPWLWSRLRFTQKATVRNMFRYKKRLVMTVVGVAGCMGLVLVGLGLHDSIAQVCDRQFSALTHYQAAVTLAAPYEAQEREVLLAALDGQDGAVGALAFCEKTVTLSYKDAVQDATLKVPQSEEALERFFTFRDRKTQAAVRFPQDGALLSEKAELLLGAGVGDTIQLTVDGSRSVSVRIAGVFENYIGHLLFLAPQTYEALLGAQPEYNQLLLRYADGSDAFERALGEFLLGQEAVQGVAFVSETVQWANDTLASLRGIVYIVLASAALLAFVVLYNLNSINITERRRELATLKVLGFYDTEVATYVYKENLLLTLLGILLGVFLGRALHQYVIVSIEVDMIMFGRSIAPASYGVGIALTLFFFAVINLAMYRGLQRIDMVQSLKSVA